MKLVKMMGGLGNQLFQYSFARYLEDLLGEPVWLDTTHFLRHRQRRIGLADLSIRYRRSIGLRYMLYRVNSGRFLKFDEVSFSPDRCLSEKGRDMFFWGYWGKAEYARAGRQGILQGFSRFPKRPIVRDLAREIGDSDSLSIHVRRGDYRGLPKYVLLDKEYYAKALDAADAGKAAKWYLFSDEKDVENDLFPDRGKLVHMAEYGLRDFEEMYLMSLCRRNIIANSTFSWWAAFLNDRDGRRIVMPERWQTVAEDLHLERLLFDGAMMV